MMETDGGELVYYLHIPKTSGTSLRATFVRAVGEIGASPPLLWDHLVDRTFTITPETRIITGHFGGLLPLWLGRWPKIITMLRSPLERALSHINHVQRNEGHHLHQLADGLGVVAYCEHPVLRATVDNLQSRHLASLDFSLALLPDAPARSADAAVVSRSVRFTSVLSSLDASTGLLDAAARTLTAIDAVGICEEHSASLEVFARTLGWASSVVATEPPRLNAAPRGQKTIDGLTDEEIEALRAVNTIDLQIYEKAKALFERSR